MGVRCRITLGVGISGDALRSGVIVSGCFEGVSLVVAVVVFAFSNIEFLLSVVVIAVGRFFWMIRSVFWGGILVDVRVIGFEGSVVEVR